MGRVRASAPEPRSQHVPPLRLSDCRYRITKQKESKRMAKKMVLCLIGAVALIVPAMAQPAIRAENGVLNASSYQPDIARGSWFVIFGSNMGPATLAISSGVPFPTELSGTRVTFTAAAGGTAIDARLWYTSAGQLAGLLPSSTAAGDYDVRVVFNNQTSPASR